MPDNPYADHVLIPYGDSASDTATLLLGAAEDLDLDPGVVRHQPEDGGFRVPEEVAHKAGLGEPDKKAAKKTAAKKAEPSKDEAEPKKTAAKKTAKKAPAKKSASKE